MIHHCKALDLDITDFNSYHDLKYTGENIPSQTSNLKHVQIIKVSDKRTCDTSFGMS